MRTPNNKQTSFTKHDIGEIKKGIEAIFASSPNIHVSVHQGRTRLVDVPSTITGIYNHFLCVTSHIKNYHDETFTINFIDLAIGKFKIKELFEFFHEEEPIEDEAQS